MYRIHIELDRISCWPADYTPEQREQAIPDIKRLMAARVIETLVARLPRVREWQLLRDENGDYWFDGLGLENNYTPEYVAQIMGQVRYDGLQLKKGNQPHDYH
jgi:hypothetical protein